MDTYDVVIVGGGAGAKLIWGSVGERSVAVVERERVGGAGPFLAPNLSGRDVAADYRAIPRAVYTDPVFASVGHTVASAGAAGFEPAVVTTPMRSTVRAIIDGATDGWSTLLADPGTGRVLGASASGGDAAEWISEVSLMIRAQIPVSVAADVVHPFPTYGEILEAPLWQFAARCANTDNTKEDR